MTDESYAYFRYHSGLGLPVFVRLKVKDHGASLPALLENMKFQEVSKDDEENVVDEMKANQNARMLTISLAAVNASRQIAAVVESDRFGLESVISKNGYKVYRYKSIALIVYSYGVKDWELGATTDFGHQDHLIASRSIINRYLSWALAPLGFIGLWGVPVDEGVVVLKQSESVGEAIFIDPVKRNILSMDGVTSASGMMNILRLDNKLHGKNIVMSRDDLLSFISMRASYLDPEGLSIIMRQLLHSLSLNCQGLIHPRESFRSRCELAL